MQLEGKSVWVMAKGFAPDEGGHQTYAEQVALAYARLGAQVTVFGQTSAGPRHTQLGPLTLIDIGAGKSPMVPLRLIAALRRETKMSRLPDLVHATTWRTAIPAMLSGFRPVVTFHGREFMFAAGAMRYAMNTVIARARRLVAVSYYSAERLKERMAGFDIAPIVAWNGTTVRPIVAERCDDPVILLSICRLEPRKNILNAVQAAALLRDRGYHFTYYICGRGPDTNNIAALIDALQLESHVKMLGFVSNDRVAELYGEASIFVHPQLSVDNDRDFEGFGIVIADAMQAGCAVVIGNSGGAPELVEDGVSGIIVDGKNTPNIADQIGSLLDDTDGRKAIGVAAHRRAQSAFSWDRHIALILDSL
jgi:glycosyltransferase involved in cell wall biosynthesis